MTQGAARPAPVKRWLQFPLWVTAAMVAMVGYFTVLDAQQASDDRSTFREPYRVTGVVEKGGGGDRDLKVSYVHPRTGTTIRASTYVWDVDLMPEKRASVALEVATDDPQRVVIAGDRFPAGENVPEYVPIVLVPLFVWALRLRHLRRTEQLIISDAPAYAMTGVAAPPGFLGRRWRLHLRPLDAHPDDPPVCTVPLIASPAHPGPLALEVKGPPRPYGRVVARVGDGEVLWPSGRALTWRAHRRPPQS